MKFEAGFEKKERDMRKENGEKLSGFDAYKDFNTELVDELLEKRSKEQKEFEARSRERIEKLEEMEKEGRLYIHE